jgi:hypothetical protein
MGKLNEIATGWANIVLKPKHVERIAKARMNICSTCEWNSRFHSSVRPDVHCVKCGCTLVAKVRSMESECPIAKWPKIKSNAKQQQQE